MLEIPPWVYDGPKRLINIRREKNTKRSLKNSLN
jgi:hypothetical protein